jgi:hypothetical protein
VAADHERKNLCCARVRRGVGLGRSAKPNLAAILNLTDLRHLTFLPKRQRDIVRVLAFVSELSVLTPIMTSQFHGYSAPASMPSSTGEAALYAFKFPSFLNVDSSKSATWLYTTAAFLISLFALEQAVWRYKKRHLPGDSWTIPIIGRFADSTKPTMEGYKRQWDSGALSAISVFNMCVIPISKISCTDRPSSLILTGPVLLSWLRPTSMPEKF